MGRPSWHQALGQDREGLKGKKVSRATLRRVWTFARPYRRPIAAYLGVIAASSLLGVVPPLVFKRLVDQATSGGDLSAVNRLGALSVVLAVAAAGLGLASRWVGSRVGEGLIYDLRSRLFDHVQRMPIAFFTRTQTGALISRLNNDVVGAQQAVTDTLGGVMSNVLTVVFSLGVMLSLSWQISVATLVIVPLFIVPSKRVGRRLQRITREQMDLNASMNTTMTERFNVAGALLVKLFGRHDVEAATFAAKARQVADIGVRRAIVGRTFFLALSLVGAVGTALVYWIGVRRVITDPASVTLGTVVGFAALLQRVYTPLTSLTSAPVDVMTAFVSFERVFEVLDAPRVIEDRPGATDLVDPRGRIEADDVGFRYPSAEAVSIASLEADPVANGTSRAFGSDPSAPVLRNVSFVAEPGTMTALVGPSGAGKTTLANLVPRLYDVTSGVLRVDGHDVRDLTLSSLADAVGVVTQDAHLFHESVGANLRYAKPDATDAELVAACTAARIHHVIAALPEGYDTVVGERGYRLSGGEKQRLAIARVLLKAPAVVILDEATAHLDSETEVHIQAALAAALTGRTSLVIAHRLSTVRAADQILVVEAGRIVERGTHDELLAAGGLYAELYETQYRTAATSSAER